MQSIRPQLTAELSKHAKPGLDIWRAPAFEIPTYRDLVEHVARLAYANHSQLLFFRGQDKDYQTKAGGSTLYPAIYRGDNLVQAELDVRFRQLASAEKALTTSLNENRIDGARDVLRKRYLQWSLLQHYEVIATPLLDVTQSLLVACSFAQLAGSDSTCYVYVLGFPFPTNRISINSEEDIVNIRLLSICPPAALRPYYQEGYMAGTPDVTTNYDNKTELDFRNRLIAKFAIPRAMRFWNAGFEATPKTALYPPNDRVEELTRNLRSRMRAEPAEGTIGRLLTEWAQLEERLLPRARQITERNLSVREAIRALVARGYLTDDVAKQLEEVLRARNMAAHTPSRIDEFQIQHALQLLRELAERIERSTA